nr:hypothetical protein [Myxococcota bacterium]
VAFFVEWTEDGTWESAVYHCEAPRHVAIPPDDLGRPGSVRGLDLATSVELPPYSSRFIATDDERGRPSRIDPVTGEYGRLPAPRIGLPLAAHEAYGEAYERWRESTGSGPRHGMFGFDRAMEGAQEPEDIVLLRLDHEAALDVVVPFVEASVLYFFISPAALQRGELGAARAVFGASL